MSSAWPSRRTLVLAALSLALALVAAAALPDGAVVETSPDETAVESALVESE
jgi:hypothetical protein